MLNVYADRTAAFDAGERALLSDLGETIGHAYHRVRMQELYDSQYRQLFEEAPVMVALTRDGTTDRPSRTATAGSRPSWSGHATTSGDAPWRTYTPTRRRENSSTRTATSGRWPASS